MTYRHILIFFLFFHVITAQAGNQSPEFVNRWNAYQAKVNLRSLQENCKPKFYSANTSTSFKGTVVLHHGFTACPQQFFELAENYLAPAGYDVVLTVLPGHGGVWDADGNDDLEGLMGRDDFEKISSEYVADINHVMEVASGERVVGGLSVGAEFALDSSMTAPQLYKKVILLSPFFRLSTVKKEFEPGKHLFLKILQEVAGPINSKRPELIDILSDPRPPVLLRPFKGLKNKRNSWGKGCSKTERDLGRAGTCDFTLDKISAVQKYGELLMNRELPQNLQIQIVGVDRDPTADVSAMIKMYERMNLETTSDASFCLLPKSFNHSLLSRFDSPSEDKFWIPSLLDQITSFVDHGKKVNCKLLQNKEII